jgi:ketosteroid isomerase-like protein
MRALLMAVLLIVTVQDADTRALLRLEDDWANALVQRDRGAFERLLADGFVYTENDQTMDRATVLNSVVAGSDTVLAAHNDSMVVHRFGPVTAVVTGWLVVGGRGASGEFRHRYRFTDTWVKRAGQWQIVAAQDYVASSR